MTMQRFSPRVLVLVVLSLLLALPALAGSAAITNGIDLWRTPGNGSTFVDFSQEPLPAGFFCASSAPFTGRVVFAGVPVKTQPAGVLGNADTVIQRLDDAPFAKGLAVRPLGIRQADGTLRQVDASSFRGQEMATTRLQVKAISFASTQPVRTGCGSFTVKASLAGAQPVTQMVILRDNEGGGRFYAPLSLNVKLTFTPTGGGPALETVRQVRFPAKPLSVWSEAPSREVVYDSFVRVDSDADGAVDVMLPGTSNFAAGFKDLPARGRRGPAQKLLSDSPEYEQPYDGIPYCGGTTRYYAVHCHGIEPVLIPE
jgi:hypothetical protein